MIQANRVTFQTNLKSRVPVGKERESLDCSPKWQPVFINLHLRTRKTQDSCPGRLTLMNVVFGDVPAGLTEKETRPQNSADLRSDVRNARGCPVTSANVNFTTLMKTVARKQTKKTVPVRLTPLSVSSCLIRKSCDFASTQQQAEGL